MLKQYDILKNKNEDEYYEHFMLLDKKDQVC